MRLLLRLFGWLALSALMAFVVFIFWIMAAPSPYLLR